MSNDVPDFGLEVSEAKLLYEIMQEGLTRFLLDKLDIDIEDVEDLVMRLVFKNDAVLNIIIDKLQNMAYKQKANDAGHEQNVNPDCTRKGESL